MKLERPLVRHTERSCLIDQELFQQAVARGVSSPQAGAFLAQCLGLNLMKVVRFWSQLERTAEQSVDTIRCLGAR